MGGMLAVRVALCAFALLHAAAALAFGADSLVVKKCAGCHERSADGRLPRVEDVRTTPEEWTVIVDRMRRLHGMPLTRDEMDRVLKELATTQLLTPDEQARVAYLSLWHNAQQREVPAGKEEERLFATCVRCHSAGKINSYRMTPGHWAKLRDEPPSEEGVCIPEHLVQHGIERAHDQVETLTFLRDHIIETETYRLGEYDLRFADLLPDSDFDCSCYPRDSNRKGTATPGLFDLVDDKEITEIAEARVTP